jgi:L-seryl-tRNA(Ser) seleniumtransferase
VSELRSLPSVDKLLQTRLAAELISQYGRPMTLQAIREVLSEARQKYKDELTLPLRSAILEQVNEKIIAMLTPTLVQVINATGVILHTNLGRAPISQAAIHAVQSLAGGYCTLEYDLESGIRGSRSVHAENLLKQLTGAEAAMVVNNNAAAVMLALAALARRKRVIISRTQLVEIGGGFRVPDVMNQSGARLVEVGTTNRVHLYDYEEALTEPAGLVLRAHHSNFRIVGFTSEPDMAEIVELAHKHSVSVMDDLGSGALLDTTRFGLAHEPTVQESLAAGVDIVCFSGDKLLGGPQAGIILGKADLVQKLLKHPLARAVRADKLCLAALSATLMHYLKNEAERAIPIWQMIAKTPEEIRARAHHWSDVLRTGQVLESRSTVGGGSLPGESLPTYVLSLQVTQPNQFLKKTRRLAMPIIARMEDDRVVLDPRTVLPEQEGALLVGLQNLLISKISQKAS